MAGNNSNQPLLGALQQADDDQFAQMEADLTAQIESSFSQLNQPQQAPAPYVPQQQALPTADRNEGIMGDLGTAFKAGTYQVPSQLTGLADIPSAIAGFGSPVSKAADALGDFTGLDLDTRADEFIAEELRPETIEGRRAISEADGFGATLGELVKNPTAAATMGVESLPGMIAGGGIAAGARFLFKGLGYLASAAIGEGSIAAGAGQADDYKAGTDTPGEAVGNLAKGVGVGVFGALGGKVAQKLGVTDLDVLFAGGGTGAGGARLLSRMAGGAISEGVFEEMPQSVFETMVDNFTAGNPLTEGVGNSAAIGLVLGAGLGSAFNIVGGRGAGKDGPVDETPDADGATGGSGLPNDLPPELVASITTPEGQLKSRAAYDELTNNQILDEWERLSGLEQQFLNDEGEGAQQALGILANQQAVLDDLIQSREIRPEQRDVAGMVGSFRNVRNQLLSIDVQLATPGKLTPQKRERLRERRTNLAQRLRTMESNFDQTELATGVAQADFNDLAIEITGLETKLTKAEAAGNEEDAAKYREALAQAEAKNAELGQMYPDMVFDGDQAKVEQAKGKTKKAAKKTAKQAETDANADAAVMQQVRVNNPVFEPIAATANPEIKADASAGLADPDNTADLEKLMRVVNNDNAPPERRAEELQKATDELEKQDGKKGNAAARKKAAASVAIVEKAMIDKGEAPPAPVAAQTATGAAEQNAQPEMRSELDIYKNALGDRAEFTAITDAEIASITEMMWSDPSLKGTKFIRDGKKGAANQVRKALESGTVESLTELSQSGRTAKWKRVLATRILNAMTEAGVDTQALAEANLNSLPADATQEQRNQLEVVQYIDALDITPEQWPNMLLADRTLKSTSRKRVDGYFAMPAEEFALKRPKNANAARVLYEAVEAIRSARAASEPEVDVTEQTAAPVQPVTDTPGTSSNAPAPSPVAPAPSGLVVPSATEAQTLDENTTAVTDFGPINESMPAREKLETWIDSQRFLTLTELDYDALDDFTNHQDLMGDNLFSTEYAPYRYFMELMGQTPQNLQTELVGKAARDAYAADMDNEMDILAMDIFAAAAKQFRQSEMTTERESVTGTDVSPVAAGTAEADALLNMTDFGVGDGIVMQKFFEIAASGKYTTPNEIVKAIAKFFTSSRGVYAPKNPQQISRTIRRTAGKMYTALAEMRGFATLEQAKEALPTLSNFLAGEDAMSRDRNQYWDAATLKAYAFEREIATDILPVARAELARLDFGTPEYNEQKIIVERLAYEVEHSSHVRVVKAQRAWFKQYQQVSATDKESRTALFFEEMISTNDEAEIEAALGVYDEPVISDAGNFGEEIVDYEQARILADRAQELVEIMDSVGDERVRRVKGGGMELVDLATPDLKKLFQQRVKKAFAMRSVGYSDQQVAAIFQAEARQEFLTEAIGVLLQRVQVAESAFNLATSGAEPTGEAAAAFKKRFESSRLKDRPKWTQLLEHRTALDRLITLENSLLTTPASTWLSDSRVRAVIESGELKPLAGTNTLDNKFRAAQEKLDKAIQRMTDRVDRAVLFKDWASKKGVPAIIQQGEITKTVEAAAELYKVGRPFNKNVETEKEFRTRVDGMRVQLRDSLKNEFQRLAEQNGRLYDNQVTGPARQRVAQQALRILHGVRAEIDSPDLEAGMGEIGRGEARTRLGNLTDAKRRDLIMRAHMRQLFNSVNDPNTKKPVDIAIATQEEYDTAVRLQRYYSNQFNELLAQAEEGQTEEVVAAKRRDLMTEYHDRQQQNREELAAMQQNTYDARNDPNSRVYWEAVKKDVESRAGNEDVSVPDLIAKMRSVYLHDNWLKLADNRHIAIAEDGAVYTIIKDPTGKNWTMYRPTAANAMPSEVTDDQVGKPFKTLKAAKAQIQNKAWLAEQSMASSRVYTAQQADALHNDMAQRVAAAMDATEGIGRQMIALRIEAQNRIAAAVEQHREFLKKNEAAKIDRNEAVGSTLGAANTQGETAMYRAIQWVRTPTPESSESGPYVVDLNDIARAMRQLMGNEVAVHPKFLMDQAMSTLYGPTAEPYYKVERAEQPSVYEQLYVNGLVTVGDVNNSRLIVGLNDLSQHMLRTTHMYETHFDTYSYVKMMTVDELRIWAELNNLAWEPDVSKVAQLTELLGRTPEQRRAAADKIKLHSPIVDMSPASVSDTLYNAELAEAWSQVFGESKRMPVLVHAVASDTDEQTRERYKPIYQIESTVDAGEAYNMTDEDMTVGSVKQLLADLGYNTKTNKITVVQSTSDLKQIKLKNGKNYVAAPGTKAVYDEIGKRIYLVADNLSTSNAASSLVHELSHKLFGTEEVARLAAVIEGWAADQSESVSRETRLAREALLRVQGSLDAALSNGVEITDRIRNHEIVAYLMQMAAEDGVGLPGINYSVQSNALVFDWVTGKTDVAPDAIELNYFIRTVTTLVNKLFTVAGLPTWGSQAYNEAAKKPHLTVEDLAYVLHDKQLHHDGKAPSTATDTLASVAFNRNAASRLAQQNIKKLPVGAQDASLAFRGYVRRGTKRLEFGDVFVENGEVEFAPSELLGGANPLRETRDIKVRRQRDAQVIAEEVNVVLSPLSQWTEKRVRKISSFIEKSTRAAQWGFVPDWANAAQPQNQNAELFAEFNRLSAQEQQLVKDVFRLSQELRDQFDAEMIRDINEGFDEQVRNAANQQELDAIQDDRAFEIEEFKKKRGPRQAAYAKLHLEGKWAVSYISTELRDAMDSPSQSKKAISQMKADPQHYFVAFAESERLAEKLRRKMITENGYPADMVTPAFPRMNQSFDSQMTEGMLQALDQKLAGFAEAAESTEDGQSVASYNVLRKALQKVYVKQLSENDLRKSELGRDNVTTYEQDMIGIFARNTRTMANNIAAVRTNRDMQVALRELTSQAQDRDNPRRKYRMEILNEQLRRHSIDSTYQESPVVNKMLSITSFKMLLTSPGYYMQNAMQPIMYTLPRIAGDFGNMPGVMRELLSEQKNFGKIWAKSTKGKNRFDISGRLSGSLFNPEFVTDPNERAMLEHLMDLNLFDVGLQAELGRVQTPGVSALGGPLRAASDMFGKMFQTATGAVRSVEIINRGSAATVAYRRFKNSKAKQKEFGTGAQMEQAAREYAVFIVRRTQGDYSFMNQPSAMKPAMMGEWSRLATQFRSFQVIQWTILLTEYKRAFRDPNASPADKAAARRTLMYLGMTHFSAAGMLGLPLMGASNFVSKTIASALGDEEDPDDIEFILYDAMGNNMLADVMIHGFPALLGINATPKLGMGTGLITPFLDAEWTREYPALWAGTVMMGASGGMVGDLVGGVGLMSDGYVLEGAMKAVAPRGVRDMVLALNDKVQGVRKYNQSRDVLISGDELSEFGTAARVLGWDTTQVNFQRSENRWVRDMRESLNERSGKIKGDWVKAVRSNDPFGRENAQREWLEYQAARVRAGMKRQPMSLLTDEIKAQNTRQLNTSGTGVQYQRTERVLRDRFARE